MKPLFSYCKSGIYKLFFANVFLLCLFTNVSFAQNFLTVEEALDSKKPIELFNQEKTSAAAELSQVVTDGVLLDLKLEDVVSLIKAAPENISLTFPLELYGPMVTLELEDSKLLAPGFNAFASSAPNTALKIDDQLHFHGKIKGDKNSLVAISIFQDRLSGLISFKGNDYVIGKLTNSATRHIVYQESDLLNKEEDMTCQMEGEDLKPYTQQQLDYHREKTTGDCVKIYVEADKSFFDAMGTTAAVMAKMFEAFNQSFVIYDNENIDMSISEMLIWDTTDPYPGPNSSAFLNQFQNNTGVFNGDLGHMVALSNVGGIAAGFSGICNADTDESLCFSGFSGLNVNVVPTYSFNVFILTHEMGHLLGSRHTHACVWNGNNTSIDGCSGFTEGSCPVLGNPAGGGTIMSYCSSTSVGVNFNLGFGPQPGNVIRNTIDAATCLEASCDPAACDLDILSVDATNTDCSGGSTGTITVSLVPGSFTGVIMYDLTGPVNQSNMTGIFTNLSAGSYSILVTEMGTMCTDTENVMVLAGGNLVVDCSALMPTASFSCLEDLPATDITAPIVVSSCGTTMTTVLDAVPTQSGCPGSVIEVIRTYTITDVSNSETETCVQIFSIQSTNGPTIVCPAGGIVECASDIVVDVNDAVVTQECTSWPTGPTVMVSGPIIIGDAECDGATYTFTYTVTDFCGRTSSCDQVFTIVNDGPTIVCAAGEEVACSDDISVNLADLMVTTSCDLGWTGEIFGPIISSNYDCPDTEYEYIYVITDDCGRTASCNRIFTIQNDAPTIVCPPDQTVECVEDIPANELLAIVTTSCDVHAAVDTVGPTLVSGLAGCDGAIYEVTYEATDFCGRFVSCTSTYTIANAAPMILTCAPDRVVECFEDIVPELHLITASSSCGLNIDYTSTEAIFISGNGTCNESVYQITYFATDECGRVASCVQIWEIENDGVKVFPPDPITISCLEDLEILDFDNCIIEQVCNIEITKTELTGPVYNQNEPLCDGSIINVLYCVWEECGGMTCAAQAITIEYDAEIIAQEFPSITVNCDVVPDPETSIHTICGLTELTSTDVIIPSPVNSDYEIRRFYTTIDACGNSFEIEQVITVDCADPALKEFCTLNEDGWGSASVVGNDGTFANVDVSASSPIILGTEAQRILITDLTCVHTLLPGVGKTEGFIHLEPEIIIDGSTDCDYGSLFALGNGQLQNSLLTKLIALNLNMRVNSTFAAQPLEEICLDIDPFIADILGPGATVTDLAELGNQALVNNYANSYDKLAKYVSDINEFFVGCATSGCGTRKEPIDIVFETQSSSILSSQLNIYPNPTNSIVNIEMEGLEKEFMITIYNVVGQVVFQQEKAGDLIMDIDVTSWSEGMYHLAVTQDGAIVKSDKFIKQN